MKISKHTDKPIIYVAHNIEYDLNKTFFKKIFLRKAIINFLKITEEKAVKKASMIFSMSEQDKQRLITLYGCNKNKIAVKI